MQLSRGISLAHITSTDLGAKDVRSHDRTADTFRLAAVVAVALDIAYT